MRIAWCLVFTSLLAGCSGGGGGADEEGPGDEMPVAVDAPTWAIRDWWNYTSPAGGVTLVVTGDSGSDWIVETDNAGVAFFNARTDVSTLGPISKAGLEGSQGDQRVRYFQWPLMDGGNWTMNLDGQAIAVTAHDMGEGAWHFEGRNETSLYMSYTYDVEVGWFTKLAFHGPDGDEAFSYELEDSGHDYTGSVDRWTLETIYEDEGAVGMESSTGNFDVPLTATDVWAAIHVTCGQGTAVVGVAPFPVVHTLAGLEDRGAGTDDPQCPMDVHYEGTAGPPAAPAQGGETETWTYGHQSSLGATGTYSLLVMVRTLETVPVG